MTLPSSQSAQPPHPNPRTPLTLAVLQCPSLAQQVDANLQRLDEAAARAGAAGAQLLLTPEMFLTGYHLGADAVRALAQDRAGAYAQAVARMA
jgi:5-aminopentanamidase